MRTPFKLQLERCMHPHNSSPMWSLSAPGLPWQGMPASLMCVQAEGVMWVVNSVFQGAGGNSRAIDTNSQDTGRPELYVRGAHVNVHM